MDDDSKDDGPIGRAVARADLAGVTGAGGLRPISAFANQLPCGLGTVAQATAARLARPMSLLDDVLRRTLLTSVGSVQIARHLQISHSLSGLVGNLSALTSGLVEAGLGSRCRTN